MREVEATCAAEDKTPSKTGYKVSFRGLLPRHFAVENSHTHKAARDWLLFKFRTAFINVGFRDDHLAACGVPKEFTEVDKDTGVEGFSEKAFESYPFMAALMQCCKDECCEDHEWSIVDTEFLDATE
jgi:hypothetical protein